MGIALRSRSLIAAALCIALAAGLCPGLAAASPLETASPIIQQDVQKTTAATSAGLYISFNFTYNAWLVNGKGAAYKQYKNWLGSKARIIYKARIKNGKLYLTGTMSKKSGKVAKMNDKAFKLTSKTKYYKHIGNNSYCEKTTKSKMTKYLKSKKSSSGGDIGIIVKNGKVTTLVAQ